MRIWSFSTRIGTLRIVECPDGSFSSYCADDEGNSYLSPDDAADDFFTHHSGCNRWDNCSLDIPDGLEEWLFHDLR